MYAIAAVALVAVSFHQPNVYVALAIFAIGMWPSAW